MKSGIQISLCYVHNQPCSCCSLKVFLSIFSESFLDETGSVWQSKDDWKIFFYVIAFPCRKCQRSINWSDQIQTSNMMPTWKVPGTNISITKHLHACICMHISVLTFLLLRWMSPMLLASELGPSSVEVLWGQSTVTSVCSPIKTLRTFSAPVTRIRGRPRRWVLKTLPYFCLRDAWKPEP